MKIVVKPAILPWFVLGSGGIGLALRSWLFALTDQKGLLPTGHIADILTYLLAAVVMAVLFLSTRSLASIDRYSDLFPASPVRAAGCALGSAGVLCAALSELSADLVSIAVLLLGVCAAAALLYIGYCRLKGLHPAILLFALPTVYLMFHAVLQVRMWSSQTQLSVHFFPLLAAIFLMLTAYHQADLAANVGNCRWFVFYSQAALFFCLLSLNGSSRLFYLGMAGWMGCDLCTLQPHTPKYLSTQEDS